MTVRARLLSLTLLALLTACAHEPQWWEEPQPAAAQASTIMPTVAPSVALAAATTPLDTGKPADEQAPALKSEIIAGKDMLARNRATPAATDAVVIDDENGVTLNFINVDIKEVAQAVLGDMLGYNYTIAPGVQGPVTVKFNRPVPKDSVLSTLSTIFKMNGAAIVQTGDVVKVVALADAPRLAAGAPSAGYSLEVVPLRYTGVEDMRKILEPIAPANSIMAAESGRNILVLAGTEDERTSLLSVIDAFDVDWLAGMSFGFFPLQEASAKAIVGELWGVLGGPNGPLGKVVRLVPFDRLNTVLAISTQPQYLEKIKVWVGKLDINPSPADQKIWIYPVQNGRAASLSETLNKLIGNDDQASQGPRAAQNAMPAPPNAPAPGASPDGIQLTGPAEGEEPEEQKSRTRIIADETTNSLIIMATREDYAVIEAALKKLDVQPLQVRVEAVIAEVTLTDDLRYGIQYLFSHNNFKTIMTKAQTLAVNSTLPGFSAFVTESDISAVLDLLQSITSVHVISSPQLMVLNGQAATLQIGDQVPVATQSAVSTQTTGAPVVNTIEMKDTGVILKVTPQVNASGMVTMDLSQEVSDVAQTTTSSLDSPTIQQRKLASSVAVRDGETIALGGLIKDSVTEGRDGIPVLEEIPLLGNLFSSTTESKTRTELLVLITPRVIRNDQDIRQVTEEMRQQMRAVVPLNAKLRRAKAGL